MIFKKNNLYFLIAVLLLIVFLSWLSFKLYLHYTTKKVTYSVIKTISLNSYPDQYLNEKITKQKKYGIEIRKYNKQTLIKTEINKNYPKRDNNAFSILADYIFGNNKKQQNIAMTAPVISKENKDTMQMFFVLPKKYNKKNAPSPNSSSINIIDMPAKKIAAIRFSGTTSEDLVQKNKKILLAVLRENNIETIGECFLYRYNDPWTPPFMRRNEVVVEVK